MTLIYFILVLGITILIHEFGHYLMAKKAHVYVYEFSIGMGPRLFKWKRKNDETEYSIRLLPIGGYVSLAGEDNTIDEKIPKGMNLNDKSFKDKLFIMVAGVFNNFVLAITLLFIVDLFIGYSNTKPLITEVKENTPAAIAGLKSGYIITKVNDHFVNNTDKLLLELATIKDNTITVTVKKDNDIKTFSLKDIKSEDGTYNIGIVLDDTTEYGIFSAIKYAFTKFISLIEQMIFIIIYLFSGRLSLNNLSGPVGIYVLVDKVAKQGLLDIIYLMAYISINVGVINILPLGAFDGGRAFILIIERITKKKINPKIEKGINTIGFILLMLLMIYVTLNDILNLF